MIRAPVSAYSQRELAVDLERELAGRCHDERARRAGWADPVGVPEQPRSEREPERDGLAGAGLGRDEQVALGRAFGEHRGLDGCRIDVLAGGKGSRQGGMGGRERQRLWAHPSWSGVATQPL